MQASIAMRARVARVLWMVLPLLLAATANAADRKSADPRFPPAKRAAIEAALSKSFAETKAPGVVVGIWIPGEGAFIAAKGFADAKTKQSMRSADYFRIGSNTKTFTATLLLIYADEKKLGLDDPVSKYTPWVPNGDRITLRMLGNMTAGLHSYTEDEA